MTAAPLPERPYLAPWYRLVPDGGRLIVEHGQRVVVLEGRAAAAFLPTVLPLLDGTRTLSELVDEVGPAVEPALRAALALLAAHRLLGEGPPHAGRDGGPEVDTARLVAASAWPGASVADVLEALATARVGVLGSAGAGALAARLLRRAGVAAAPLDWDAEPPEPGDRSLVVVAPEPREVGRLPGWNERALRLGVRWLLLLPYDGLFATVGPLFVPEETACYECFRLRRLANVAYPAEFALVESTPTASPSPPALDAVLAGAAALALVRLLGVGDGRLAGAFQALELRPGTSLDLHHVLRVPRCPACSPAAGVAAPLPWARESGAAA